MINVLILSCGTRNKIVQYFRENLKNVGRVVCTDCSELAPALYEADTYYIVPRMSEVGYIDVILDICEKENITGVLSLIDPELSLLAENKDKFANVGVTVIGSSYELCELALDKYKMYNWLNDHKFLCAKSYIDKETFYYDIQQNKINYPVFVKPYNGSASLSISKVEDRDTLENILSNNSDLMIQEYLKGQEIGVDIYIDMISKEVISIFAKKKIRMRAGETEKSVSFKDEKLFELVNRFCLESGYVGQIDMDIFDIEGEYYISEVNPRFGGGYPHAYELGVNHIQYIINNLKEVVNESKTMEYEDGVYMAKYNEISIIRG